MEASQTPTGTQPDAGSTPGATEPAPAPAAPQGAPAGAGAPDASGVSLDQLTPQARAELLAEFQARQRILQAQAAQAGAAPAPSPEEVAAERQQADYYCPGCGRTSDYRKQCSGTSSAPHEPIEVVPTDELGGDPADHTAAPGS